jgi:hypothetical protein
MGRPSSDSWVVQEKRNIGKDPPVMGMFDDCLRDYASTQKLSLYKSKPTPSGEYHYAYCRTHAKCKVSYRAVHLHEGDEHYII